MISEDITGVNLTTKSGDWMQISDIKNYTLESGVQVMIGIVLLTGMETHRRDETMEMETLETMEMLEYSSWTIKGSDSWVRILIYIYPYVYLSF